MAFTKLEPSGVNTSATFTFANVVTDNLYHANGTAWSSGGGGSGNSIANGSSNVSIPTSDGNIKIAVGSTVMGNYWHDDGTNFWYPAGGYDGKLFLKGTANNTTYTSVEWATVGGSNLLPQRHRIASTRNANVNSSHLEIATLGDTASWSPNIYVRTYLQDSTGDWNTASISANVVLLDRNGNTTIPSLIVGTSANLGSIANVKITGGTTGQVLTTDGSGGLSWAAPTSPYGNSNVTTLLSSFGSNSISTTGSVTASTLTGTLTTNAQPNITSVGSLTALTVTGTTNLGAVTNLKITGGLTNQVLTTDGLGNLSWTAGGGGGGSSGGAGFITVTKDVFTATGSANTYTLSITPSSAAYVVVNIDGIVQQLSSYSLSTNVLTIVGMPSAGEIIEITSYGVGGLPGGSNTQLQFNDSGVFQGAPALTFNKTTSVLTVSGNITSTNANLGNVTGSNIYSSGNITSGSKLLVGLTSTTLVNPVAVFSGSGATYDQVAVINSTGTGSADITTYGNNGDDTQSWTDIGFTGNSFSDANYTVTAAGDGYLFVQGNTSFGGNLVLATGNTGTTKDIVFATGGFQTGNIKARLYNANGIFSVTTGITTAGTLNVTGTATFASTQDITVSGTPSGTVNYDIFNGVVFDVAPTANWTANVSNIPAANNRTTVLTFIVTQGSTPYVPNVFQISGTPQTVKWLNGTAPTGTASKVDVISYSLVKSSTGTITVLGQSATYG